jgi:hypothetical protein
MQIHSSFPDFSVVRARNDEKRNCESFAYELERHESMTIEGISGEDLK